MEVEAKLNAKAVVLQKQLKFGKAEEFYSKMVNKEGTSKSIIKKTESKGEKNLIAFTSLIEILLA